MESPRQKNTPATAQNKKLVMRCDLPMWIRIRFRMHIGTNPNPNPNLKRGEGVFLKSYIFVFSGGGFLQKILSLFVKSSVSS